MKVKNSQYFTTSQPTERNPHMLWALASRRVLIKKKLRQNRALNYPHIYPQ